MRYIRSLLLFFLCLIVHLGLDAQPNTNVDEHGIMRWTETGEEVCAFGTNYSVPFAYWDWREPIGADYEKAIDEDVYHIARLGLDGYRIHVWESYISDTLGNLIYNRHFQLFDYLLFKLKERGIKAYITPMYINGGSKGFTYKYGMKQGCLSDTSAFPAQENYLSRFVSHVNPYTGIAYKDDPDILAFEIVNEPHHFKRPDLVRPYISRMYNAIRDAGCDKPIFYNMTTAASYIDEILPSEVQGGSFNWYPSGLTSNQDQKGNMLPNVDHYYIPFADDPGMKHRAKFVYEFSPSDIGASSHIYPAMARSFREAGFQFAAQFAYDPMHAAYCNVEYRTHYLNLAYTPKKAIGMMIASEVFHRLPLGKDYGSYPDNRRFDAFHLSSENDLAEMLTEHKFLYSNSTSSVPPAAEALEQVAGTGTSPVVKYKGTGAYFLDKLEDGVWRLELMPDAQWVRDPFFVPHVEREAAVILWKDHPMSIFLPDLGEEFKVFGLNDGNELDVVADGKTFTVSPGTFLLTRKGLTSSWDGNDSWKNIHLKEFHAPERELTEEYLIHKPPHEISAETSLKLSAKIIMPFEAEQVELIILKTGGGEVLPMKQVDSYMYEVDLSSEYTTKPGILMYHISIKKGNEYLSFPSGEEGPHLLKRRIYTGDRSLIEGESYQIRIVDKNSPLCLFDADRDWLSLTKMKRNDEINCYPSPVPGKSMMHLSVNNLNMDEHNYSVRSYCRESIEARPGDVEDRTELVIYGNSLNNRPCKIQVALLMMDGSAYGGILSLDKNTDSYVLPLKDLEAVKSMLLPRPYPKFQAYWFEPAERQNFDISKVESLQISIGPGIPAREYDEEHGVAIGWVVLQ